MTLFDEVNELGNESHEKWFNRYFDKCNLEAKIKKQLWKGTTPIVSILEKNQINILQKDWVMKGQLICLKTGLAKVLKLKN